MTGRTRSGARRARRARSGCQSFLRYRKPLFELLEDRRLLAAVTVTNNNDVVNGDVTSIAALIATPGADGISLREAIQAANTDATADDVTFSAALNGTTINLSSTGQLPITQALTIDASALAAGITIKAFDTGAAAGDGTRIFNVDDNTGAPITVSLNHLTLTGGDPNDAGGAIFSRENLTIANCTLTGNRATIGAGISVIDGTTSITGSTISNNSASNLGGGIAHSGGTATITTTTISGNSAVLLGGGVFANNGAAVEIEGSTISGNSTSGIGGGINLNGAPTTISNSTISGNSSNSNGGGIYANVTAAAPLMVLYSTITRNTSNVDANASGSGGGMYFGPGTGTVTLKNTIIAGNTDFTSKAPDIDNTSAGTHPTINQMFTLVGNNKGSGLAAGALIGTPAAPINPLLGALTNNGGPTRTHALLTGSPAINMGDPAAAAGIGDVPMFDQRGTPFARVAGAAIDIGAFELVPPPTVPTMALLASSDTGMFNNDRVTNKMQPAFGGVGPTNVPVYVYAQLNDSMGNPLGDPFIVGIGTVGSDATDGFVGNGLGAWEITVEPLADGKYNFFARFLLPEIEGPGFLSEPVADTPRAFMSVGGPVNIPDGPDGVAISPITVSATPPLFVADVNVTVNITHPNVGDLTLTLVSPSGTSILLSNQRGGTGDNFTNTVFDDAATTSITGIVPAMAPFTGSFQPEEPLSTLFGEPANGTWRLFVTDNAAGNTGQIVNWTLSIASPIMVVIDTVEPNTPFLDLLDDTGRSSVDNITKDNTPNVSMTTTDPNIALAQLLYTDNLKFRVYDRFQSSAQEVLIYDSAQDATADAMLTAGDMFTALTQLTRTLPALAPNNPAVVNGTLADGVHNLKLEVEDRAGNISHDFFLQITVDTAVPPVSFGLPDGASQIDGLAAESDTGVTTMPATFSDRVTSDSTPKLWGRAEANTVVRVYLDRNANGIIDLLTDTFLGQTVAVPFDGNDAYPQGYWELVSALDLNELVGLPKDGLRRLLVTAEDVAGNPMAMNLDTENNPVINQGVDELQIFIDTQGPQITDVTVNNLTSAQYDVFDPKPTQTGFTPLVTSLRIAVRDLPNRLDQTGTINDFLYEALKADIAGAPGNYLLVGDHVGTIAIQSIVVTNNAAVSGQPATSTVELKFFDPLPDDRYRLTVRDNLVDPVGNKLDGESHAAEPQENPIFPSGDGVPGGNFVARFTVDSRPEIANYVSTQINIDINGNFVWDPGTVPVGGDATNVDVSFTLPVQNADGTVGLGRFNVHDLLFAGKFRQIEDEKDGNEGERYFDQLGAYGFSSELGAYRWIIDTNSDGVVRIGTDIRTVQPTLGNFDVAGAIPVAGNFDNNADNGDEIGLYNAGKWFLDTNRNFVIGAGDTLFTTNLLGHPIVGDFDGDGKDDLAVFNNNVFSFNLANDGFGDANDATIVWGFPGVLDRPVAADMDQDGIDDIGLWVPRSDATLPQGVAQWYFLISNDFTAPGVPAAHMAGSIAKLNHAFTPTPFGKDIFAEFGDQLSLPVVGNFDPPVAASVGSSGLAGDYDANGRVDNADKMVWMASFGSTTNMAADGNHDGRIDTADYVVWRNNLGAVAASGAGSTTLTTESLSVWTVEASAAVEVAEPVVESASPETATASSTAADVVAVDDFFARLDHDSPANDSAATLSAAVPVWENNDLLLTTLATPADGSAAAESIPRLADDPYVDEELVDELLTDFAGVGAAFESI